MQTLTTSYTCAVLSPENNTVFAVGSDKTLKELSNCQIVNDVPSSNKANPAEVVLTQVHKGLRGFIIFIVSTASLFWLTHN